MTVKQKVIKEINSLPDNLLEEAYRIISKLRKTKKVKPDAVSLLAENAIAEEWNSKEDEAWDKVL